MIADFYKDKTILLTGCTGFLGKFFSLITLFCKGKVVLEKILRSLPVVKTIYLAITPKVSGHVTNWLTFISDDWPQLRVLSILIRDHGVTDL